MLKIYKIFLKALLLVVIKTSVHILNIYNYFLPTQSKNKIIIKNSFFYPTKKVSY